jgi:TetR/AcrR family transcriptional regulator, regulator of autoinduction and epiphytic fitness
VGETSVTASDGEAQGGADGRVTRGARTRAAVVDALLALNERGNLRPTAREIATEAGVSLRSVYVHFDDIESLFLAASARHGERMAALLPRIEWSGSLDERLALFLLRRRRLNEEGAAIRRAAVLQEPFSAALRRALARGREILRAETAVAFAPEIDVLPPERRAGLARALDAVTSPTTWEALRSHQKLSAGAAEAQVRDMVLALVHGWRPVPSGTGPTADTDTGEAGGRAQRDVR